MKRWRLLIASFLAVAFLSGCSQAPAASVSRDVSTNPATTAPAVYESGTQSIPAEAETLTAETEVSVLTEPIPETQSAEPSEPTITEEPSTEPIQASEKITSEPASALKPSEAAVLPTIQVPAESKPTAPAHTEPKPTEPAPTQPEHTEPVPPHPEPTEPAPTQPLHIEPAPTSPKPTEPQTEPSAEAPEPYDLDTLIAYANSYAKSTYGFVPDSSLNLGNASYYPGFYGSVSSEQDLYTAAISQVQYAYSCFQALGYDLDGLHCNLHAEYEAAIGMYYLTFLYG